MAVRYYQKRTCHNSIHLHKKGRLIAVGLVLKSKWLRSPAILCQCPRTFSMARERQPWCFQVQPQRRERSPPRPDGRLRPTDEARGRARSGRQLLGLSPWPHLRASARPPPHAEGQRPRARGSHVAWRPGRVHPRALRDGTAPPDSARGLSGPHADAGGPHLAGTEVASSPGQDRAGTAAD